MLGSSIHQCGFLDLGLAGNTHAFDVLESHVRRDSKHPSEWHWIPINISFRLYFGSKLVEGCEGQGAFYRNGDPRQTKCFFSYCWVRGHLPRNTQIAVMLVYLITSNKEKNPNISWNWLVQYGTMTGYDMDWRWQTNKRESHFSLLK